MTKKAALIQDLKGEGISTSVKDPGVFGMASMWAALLADTGVTLIAVLNSMRALKMKP